MSTSELPKIGDVELEDYYRKSSEGLQGCLDHLSYEERLRYMELFSLEKRSLSGGLMNMYKYPRKESKEEGARFFLVVPSDRTKGNGHKLKHRKLPLNISKDILSVRVSKHQQSLPREIAASLSTEKSESHLDMVLGHWPFLKEWLGPSDFQRSLLTSTICDSV